MNTEDDEFQRIEAETKRRAARDEDDDTQTYTSESAKEYSWRCGYEAGIVHAAIKEALAQPQEPVAYCYVKQGTNADALTFDDEPSDAVKGTLFPLYAHSQRPWQGLTDDEIRALASWWPSYDQMPALIVLAKDIQNSLKERNND